LQELRPISHNVLALKWIVEFTPLLYRLENVLLIQLDLFAWHEQLAKNYYWVFIGNIALLAYKNGYIGLISYIGEYEYNSISELFVLNEHPVADASILDAHRAMGR
jgi:hypothetical protein